MTAAVRALAARVVADVIGGSAMDGPLDRAREKLPETGDRALLSALCFGTVRHYFSNRRIVRALLSRPNQKLKPAVEALLILGIEQLEHMRVAPHAAVSETVAAARTLKLKGATGLINALLRRFQREREQILAAQDEHDDFRFDHPAWLLRTLRADWPEDWQNIVKANNAPAPQWLRVNASRNSVSDYQQRLAELDGVSATTGSLVSVALNVEPTVPVAKLPGFHDGDVTVQDQSAQLASALVSGPKDGEPPLRILDACAAPGGKTGHLLERFPDSEVVAVDSSEARLVRLRENLDRMGHRCEVRCMDLTDAGQAAGLGTFNRVLLDAPCTGSGVIRRHPDIKMLRRAGDSAKLTLSQLSLLTNLFARLAPGGELLYVTCSVFRAENDAVVGAFVDRTPEAKVQPVDPAADWGRATQYGRQMLPGEAGADGFFYARLVRQD